MVSRLRNPVKELNNANTAIEHSIDHLEFEGRGPVSRDVIGNIRHLVEHVAMCAVHGILLSLVIISSQFRLLLADEDEKRYPLHR